MKHLATDKGAKAIFLFIAELNGFKSGKISEKLFYGQQCWVAHRLHTLNLSNEEDRAELHENIWLERLYEELDQYYNLGLTGHLKKSWVQTGKRDIAWLTSEPSTTHKWETPIELDASALTLSVY